jgi:hypothetical protein
MNGLSDLHQLLAKMAPELGADEYVFASFPGAKYADLAYLTPVASIQEADGLSLVLERSVAENARIPFDSSFRKISLQVHSSLDSVGLTAAISHALAESGISANVIAGYFHDHIFVPSAKASQAIEILKNLS